jgi:hypothetical protein
LQASQNSRRHDEQSNPSPASAIDCAENRVQIVAAGKPSFELNFFSSLLSFTVFIGFGMVTDRTAALNHQRDDFAFKSIRRTQHYL